MFNWNDFIVEDQRRQDERTAAAEWRRTQHVMRDGQTARARRQPILALLGAQLVVLGCRLQARYDTLVEPAPVSAGDGHVHTLACDH